MRVSPATMVKEKTAALERAKKATAKAKGRATSRGGSSSRAGLPQGWIQGDWIRSTIRQEDLDDLADGGLIPHGSVRLPGKESEPQPQEGECVLLATHIDRGFSLPPHPFFRGSLNFFIWRTLNDKAEEIFRLTSCSAARGFSMIQISGSAWGGGGRSNRMG